MTINNVEETLSFCAADLHVHTPASNCYRGNKDNNEYFEIIRKYYEKNIKIVAITDHNTIAGYKNIISNKYSIVEKIKTLKSYVNKYPELQEEIDELEKYKTMFEKMLIIPGIELDVKPGIHLLLLFDPNTRIEKLEEFLEINGYDQEMQGFDNPSNITLELIDALEMAAELGGFGIGAHVDSNKGIYNVLREGGQYRAQILKSKHLLAVEYNNPRIPPKIQTILDNREYRRDYPLSFIQCSDYHGDNNLGEPITYIKMSEMTFSELCNSLKTYNECVSATERPEIKSILEKVINDRNTIIMEDINQDNISAAVENVCALLNNGMGNLVIGAVNNNIIGTNLEADNLVEIVDFIKKAIKNPHGYMLEPKVFPYGLKSAVVINCKPVTGNIFYLTENSNAFVLKDGKAVEANAEEIALIVEKNLLDRLELIQDINKPNTKDLITKLDALVNCSSNIDLINKIERNSMLLTDFVTQFYVKPLEGGIKTTVFEALSAFANNNMLCNGNSDGNVIILEHYEPRLSYAYLRCSCPRYNIEDLEFEKTKGPLIVVAPGGGTYLLDGNEDISLVSAFRDIPILCLRLLHETSYYNNKITNKYLIGWLKSSLAIWYSLTAWGSYDFRNINILKKVPIPIFWGSSIVEKVDGLIENILKQENNFLFRMKSASEQDMNDVINNHNSTINGIASEIDALFYEAFCITDKQISIINATLDKHELFVLTQ